MIETGTNDRFLVRMIFNDPKSAKKETLGYPRPDAQRPGSTRAPYWATTFDQMEAADSDPELIAALFGISEYSPEQDFSLVIIDTQKMPLQAERATFIPTYDKMTAFGEEELANELEEFKAADPNIMASILTPRCSEEYYENITAYLETGESIHNQKEVKNFANATITDPTKRNEFMARYKIQGQFGANELFSGNGLTKVDPNSRYAEQIGQKYGMVETFTFERDPLTIGKLKNAVLVIPAIPLKEK